MPAHLELRQVAELLFSDTGLSADGRMNIDSKRTSNHDRDFDLREFFQIRWQRRRHCRVDVHSAGDFEQLGIARADADRGRNTPQSPLHKPIDKTRAQSSFAIGNADCTSHRRVSLRETGGPITELT